MTTQVERVIAKGNIVAAEKLLRVELEKQNRTKFDTELREEYEGVYPEYRTMTDEEYDEYINSLSEGEVATPQEDTKVKIEYIAEDGTRTPAEYLTYSEWVVAKVQREETYEEYQQAGGDLSEDDFNDSEQYTKKLVDTDELVRPYIPLTQEELDEAVTNYTPLADKKKELELAKVNKQAEDMLTEYPQYERDSFITQEAEARAYKADNEASVPLISGIAAARGIEVDELADKIIEKADLFKQAIGYTIGQRQVVAG